MTEPWLRLLASTHIVRFWLAGVEIYLSCGNREKPQDCKFPCLLYLPPINRGGGPFFCLFLPSTYRGPGKPVASPAMYVVKLGDFLLVFLVRNHASQHSFIFIYFIYIFYLLILEREGDRERQRERHTHQFVVPFIYTLFG